MRRPTLPRESGPAPRRSSTTPSTPGSSVPAPPLACPLPGERGSESRAAHRPVLLCTARTTVSTASGSPSRPRPGGAAIPGTADPRRRYSAAGRGRALARPGSRPALASRSRRDPRLLCAGAGAGDLRGRRRACCHTEIRRSLPARRRGAMACGLPVVSPPQAASGARRRGGGVGGSRPVDWERDHRRRPSELAAGCCASRSYGRFAAAARERAVSRYDVAPWVKRHREVFPPASASASVMKVLFQLSEFPPGGGGVGVRAEHAGAGRAGAPGPWSSPAGGGPARVDHLRAFGPVYRCLRPGDAGTPAVRDAVLSLARETLPDVIEGGPPRRLRAAAARAAPPPV